MTSRRISRATFLILLLIVLRSDAAPIPTNPTLPTGLGVNIHFTHPKPGEMEMIAAAGFTTFRMDLAWSATERRRGEYDFSAYDHLLAACEAHHIRPYLILDYGNRLYDNDQSPHTDEARNAMAAWAAAAVLHLKGRNVIWEMWNEPNIKQFWKPVPNVEDYIALTKAVGAAIRKAGPGETFIGPAASTMDFKFLEPCLKAGLLEYWDAVSVHPYRQTAPETASADYRRLRELVEKYAPAGKAVPILSGEWGYSAAWSKYDANVQGKMLPRQFLTNAMNGVPVSIWYDWHDDGTDPKEAEHHFGTVLNPYHENRTPPYDPKPAYLAVKSLTTELGAYRFAKRLEAGNPADDYVLLFVSANDANARKLAVWTTSAQSHRLTIPGLPSPVTLTDTPQYLAPAR
jgi:hypothetical protein